MKFWQLLILFLTINFGGLAIGSWLMDNGPMTDWYLNLNKAPWTPPGWVFGFAWTTIMICFSIYLAKLFQQSGSIRLWLLFVIQFVLNVSWNYVFFNEHLILFGFVIILALTILIFYFFSFFKSEMKKLRLLLMPYMLWLLIATSLNFYIYLYN